MLTRKIPLNILIAQKEHPCLIPNLRGDAFSLPAEHEHTPQSCNMRLTAETVVSFRCCVSPHPDTHNCASTAGHKPRCC